MIYQVRFGVLAVVFATLALAAATVRAAVEIGQPASLAVPELDGRTFDLAPMRGRVVIVNFWATWCPPCRAEMPALDAVYRRYHPAGLEMLGLSADRTRDRSDVVSTMKSFAYPAAMLEDATTNDLGSPAALPVTYVIDRNGVVRDRITPDQGALTEARLKQIVMPLLAQKAVPAAVPAIQ